MNRKAFLLLVPLFFIFIYFRIFWANYAFLDEIYQLWHNKDGSNLYMFLTEGRWLSGLLVQKCFSAIATISHLRHLRMFSLFGWMLTAFLFFALARRWTMIIPFDASLVLIGTMFIICGLATIVYIGWASCLADFPAVIAGLLSGHLLFIQLAQKQINRTISATRVLLSVVLGVISLFFYQTSFGIFLLPFFLYYLHGPNARPRRVVLIGVGMYLLIYVIYFFLFQLSLEIYHVAASDRAHIRFDLVEKIAFFFAGPLAQSFSLNLLFRPNGVFSQIFYVVILLGWIASVMASFRRNPKGQAFVYVAMVFALLILMYLPSVIAAENANPYRTTFVLDLAVFILIAQECLKWLKTDRARKKMLYTACVYLLLTGWYAYNVQWVTPLAREYQALRTYMEGHYSASAKRVVLVRADRDLFKKHLHAFAYNDEFGVPSTFKDWVPEPIVKQMALEVGGSRQIADRIEVQQVENEEAWLQMKDTVNRSVLVIDVNSIVK